MGAGDHNQSLALVRRDLSPAAWEMLEAGGQMTAAMTYQSLADELEAGRLALLSGEMNGCQVLGVIVRTEDLIDGGRELCVVAVAGKNIGTDYTRAVLPALEREVGALGYSSVLVRTAHRAMARKVMLLGYRFCESTFRRELG